MIDSSLFSCLEIAFPGISKPAQRIEKLGFRWSEISKAFVKIRDGKIISHVGVGCFEATVEGRKRSFGALHAITTHPDFRKQKFATQLIKEALGYCKEHFDTTVLFTDIPDFYKRFGFHIIQESYFSLKVNPGISENSYEMKEMNSESPEDCLLFKRLHLSKKLISHRFGIQESGAIMGFNCLFQSPLFQDTYYSKEKDALIAYKKVGKTLKIFDVICKEMLPLQDILSIENGPFEEVLCYFSPELWTDLLEPIPFPAEEGLLMALDPDIFPKKPFMIPPLSRC